MLGAEIGNLSAVAKIRNGFGRFVPTMKVYL